MTLDPEQKQAGIAAGVLLATLVLPWYRKSVAIGNDIVNDNLSAFEAFTFVEAAILLVALGVFVLLYARSRRKPFHLPGGDGTVILAAGAWAGLLLVWRLFDTPDVEGRGASIGVTWGFFFAFLAAAVLAATGFRMRVANRPEPPNPVAEPVEWEEAPTRRVRTPRSEAPTRRVAAGDPFGDAETRVIPEPEPPPRAPEFLRPREPDPPDDDDGEPPQLWQDR